MVRALVVGAGSIGSRYATHLVERESVEHVTVMVPEGHAPNLPERPDMDVVASTEGVDCDIAVVATDTAHHVEVALPLVTRGVDTLIEKPVSHNMEGLDALARAASASGAKVFVGYNMRFLPGLLRLRDAVASGMLGRVCSARFEAGQWLPDWRPGRDYRETYSACIERGGGVRLDLSHEIDAMRFVLGDPSWSRTFSARASDLEIDSDDIFEGVFGYASGMMASVHLDYLARHRVRSYGVLGTKGDMVCDVSERTLMTFIEGEKTIETDPALFDVTETYDTQMDQLLAAHAGAETGIATLEDGVAVLRLLESSRESEPWDA